MAGTVSRRLMLAAAAGSITALGTGPAWAHTLDPIRPGQHRYAPLADTDTSPFVDQTLLDTSFEDSPEVWLSASTSYDSTVARTGSRSLRYDRTDSVSYDLANATFSVEPGRNYTATTHIRTTALGGPARQGGRIGIEAYNAAGKWISGAYSGRFLRANEWFEFSVTYQAPPTAATIKVILYLHRGSLGTAWFDDLTVVERAPRGIMTTLLTPSFRGWLIPGDHDAVTARTAVDLSIANSTDHVLRTTLSTTTGTVVASTEVPVAALINHSFPAGPLPTGDLVLRTELVASADDTTLVGEEWGLAKLATVPTLYVDRHRRLIRDGNPVFPLGMYTSRNNAMGLELLDDTPFDTLLSYIPFTAAQLDRAAELDIDVIFPLNAYFHDSLGVFKPAVIDSVASEVPAILDTVAQFGNHPALLGWYVGDEPRIEQYRERFIDHHQAVIDADPDHLTYLVDNKVPEPGADYLRCADVFGIDSYPVYGKANDDIDEPERLARGALTQIPGRAMWHVPQAFAWGAAKLNAAAGRFPTPTEFRNISWQMITEGATGLIWWNLHHLGINLDTLTPGASTPDYGDPATYAENIAIANATASEIADLIPVLLSIESPPTLTGPSDAWLNTVIKAHAGQAYLFAVNNTTASHSANFGVSAAMSVEVLGEDRTVPVSSEGQFVDGFASLDVHLYRIELPTASSLAELTRTYLVAGDTRRGEQLAKRAPRLLGTDHTLDQYRRMVESWRGTALTDDQAHRLTRLSHHLVR